MILDKPYIEKKPHINVDLQFFAGKVRNKADGISKEDLEELKKTLGDDDSDDDDDEPDYDYDDDEDDDEKEDIDEDPDNDPSDEDDEEDDDSDDDESDEDEEDSDEESEDDDEEDLQEKFKPDGKSQTNKPEKGGGKDKKTSAIIALKNENKELRARLDAIERMQREREYETEIDRLTAKYTEELIEDGMDEERAKRRARQMAEDKIETKKAADRDIDIQVERLEERGYTDIRSKLSILRPLVQKSGLTLEEAYRAKFGEVKPKEKKTREEQLALLNKNKTSSKRIATITGSHKKEETVVLSKRDERIYKEMRKMDPKLTRKAFANLMKDFEE